ncbi:MAG: histidine kinase [Eubacteriales bacterium]|nr:histidine kinase [Eubacteriales bacterium]
MLKKKNSEAKKPKAKKSIQNRLIRLIMLCIIPLVILLLYTLAAMNQFSERYEVGVRKIARANEYNLTFKEKVDYGMYIIIINSQRAETLITSDVPRNLIHKAQETFQDLEAMTTDSDSRFVLRGLNKNLETLKNRAEEIEADAKTVGMYDQNMKRLDMDIRILTELIQEGVQEYISIEVDRLEDLRLELREQIKRVISAVLLILVLILILSITTSRKIMKRLTTGFDQLRMVTQKAGKGDFQVRANLEENDIELEELGYGFNQMVERLDTLMDDIRIDQLNLRMAEQKLLQAQINPHFLYNTLDAITWLAESGEKEQVVQMVAALSDFFRTTLSKGREFITIEEERAHIESYLKIQQFRYQDILDYEIDIPKEIYPYQMLKLMLQPLVENALYHGIKNKRGKGMIRVKGWEEDGDIWFSVKDNGMGMTAEQLELIRHAISLKQSRGEEPKSFGLYNVMQRIQLYYGTPYGIEIKSEYGVGSEVLVHLPKKTNS